MIRNKGFRWVSFVLSSSMVLGMLSGCGDKQENDTAADTGAVTEAAGAVQSPTDGSSDVAGDDIFTDVIELKDNGYAYDSEEIMYLSGVKMSAYKEDMKYSLSDLNEDTISELFISKKDGNDEQVAVYVYDAAGNVAKRECIYDVTEDKYIEQPSDGLKEKIDYIRVNPNSINWVGSDQWVDGNIIGVATEVEDPGIKTDYYLSSNYKWLSEKHINSQGDMIGDVALESAVWDRKVEMLENRDKYQGEDIQRLRDYYDISLNWDKRNSEGVEPLKKYIDAINNVNSMDDLTAYLIDHEKNPFCNMMNFDFTVDMTDTSHWVLEIYEDDFSVLPRMYHNEAEEEIEMVRMDFYNAVTAVMEKAGYEKAEIDKLLKESIEIENKLLDKSWPSETGEKDELDGYFEIDELDGNCQHFPLKELLNSYNIKQGKVKFIYPDYMRQLDELYVEENLEALKAYLLTHMIFATYQYLDYDSAACLSDAGASEGDAAPSEEMYDAYNTQYQQDVLSARGLLSVAEENAYMTYYVDPEAKEDITKMAVEIKDAYREMLEESEWLSDEGKKAALEKLDSMTFSVMSPDTLIDSSYLKVDPEMSYVDAYAKLLVSTRMHNGEFIGQARIPGDWRYDLRQHIATTESNAYYFGSFNQFFILAGFIDDVTYSKDMSREEKLGRIGETVGHELTHAFDPNGIAYDKDGNQVITDENPYGWLPKADYDAFMEKAGKVSEYFNNIYPFPYEHSDGNLQWGEAVADMGGLAIGLKIAEKEENFDYDAFFRSHSDLWKRQSSLIYDRSDIHDAHPLCHLRINSVYQQFEEFYETYDIKEGDMMYIAPEDRIVIW